jgi:hypothetical protein
MGVRFQSLLALISRNLTGRRHACSIISIKTIIYWNILLYKIATEIFARGFLPSAFRCKRHLPYANKLPNVITWSTREGYRRVRWKRGVECCYSKKMRRGRYMGPVSMASVVHSVFRLVMRTYRRERWKRGVECYCSKKMRRGRSMGPVFVASVYGLQGNVHSVFRLEGV